jgi:hypothetical protein
MNQTGSALKRTQFIAVLLLVATTAWGCATTINWLQEGQGMSFDSEPRGAEVFIDGELRGKTPLNVRLKPRKRSSMIVRKAGYVEEIKPLNTEFNLAFLGNIISGGVFGSTTDAATDNLWKYSPTDYFVQLRPQDASPEDTALWEEKRRLRGFVLNTHVRLARELAIGGGEYTDSLLALLGVAEQESADAVALLHRLSLTAQSPVDFMHKVEELFQFGQSRG